VPEYDESLRRARPAGHLRLVPEPPKSPKSLELAFASALERGDQGLNLLASGVPTDERDALLTLLRIYDLHLAPVATLGGHERWQHHPAVAGLKWQLEERFIESLLAIDGEREWDLPVDAVAAIRQVAAVDRVPRIYDWLAESATLDELTRFITLEGGPDGGFDDLVAVCQLGLSGEAKLEMARNYWDEMGRGEASRVHTQLHRQMAQALNLDPVSRESQPLAALRRSALGPFLATNRARQAEMVGALGLIELQAGPRCRRVVSGLERLRAPSKAMPFYAEHATTDPIHGREWLARVVGNFAGGDPSIAHRVVQGARWRSSLNRAFLQSVGRIVGLPRQGDRTISIPVAG
jgi:hypothetical protein